MAAPGVPGDLDSTAKAFYRKVRERMRDEGRWGDSDHHLLHVTARAEMMMRLALADMKDGGKLRLDSIGSKGQSVQHPSWKTYREARADYVDGLKELGFTPRARAAMGIEPKPQGGGKFGF